MKLYTIQDDAGSQLQSSISMDGCHIVIALRTYDNEDNETQQKYFCSHEDDIQGLIDDLIELKKTFIQLK